MKKYIVSLIAACLFSLAFVSVGIAYDLTDYPEPFIKDGKYDVIIVVGETAPTADVLAAVDIATSLKQAIGDTGPVETKLDSEITSLAQNIISVGSPCANKISAKIIGSSTADCNIVPEPAQAILKIYEQEGYAQLIVSGYADREIRAAAKVLANYNNYALEGKEMCIDSNTLSVKPGLCEKTSEKEKIESTKEEIKIIEEIESVGDEVCEDSDGGKDYYMKGTVTWAYGNAKSELTDCCMESSGTGCSYSGILVMERFCKGKYSDDWEIYSCPGECIDGACLKKGEPKEAVEKEPEEEEVDEIQKKEDAEEESKVMPICGGCTLNEKCYPFGYRKSWKYCSDDELFKDQLEAEEDCENNFECKSNVCISEKCVNAGLIQKVIEWFKRWF